MNMREMLLLFGSLVMILTSVEANNEALDRNSLAKRLLKLLESEIGKCVTIASTSCKKEIMLQQLDVVQSTMRAFELELTDCFIISHEYTGKRNLTKSGLVCQNWMSMAPLKLIKNRFPELENAGNYCRDPTHSGTPWCFTMDSKTRVEECAVPRCDTLQ